MDANLYTHLWRSACGGLLIGYFASGMDIPGGLLGLLLALVPALVIFCLVPVFNKSANTARQGLFSDQADDGVADPSRLPKAAYSGLHND